MRHRFPNVRGFSGAVVGSEGVGAKAWGWDQVEELEGVSGLGVSRGHGLGANCLGDLPPSLQPSALTSEP